MCVYVYMSVWLSRIITELCNLKRWTLLNFNSAVLLTAHQEEMKIFIYCVCDYYWLLWDTLVNRWKTDSSGKLMLWCTSGSPRPTSKEDNCNVRSGGSSFSLSSRCAVFVFLFCTNPVTPRPTFDCLSLLNVSKKREETYPKYCSVTVDR